MCKTVVAQLDRYWWMPTIVVFVLSVVSLAAGEQLGEPNDTAVVRQLAPELPNPVLVLKPDDLGQTERRVLSEQGMGFRFEGDFNSDGRQDLLWIGQYGNDRRRSFVLIATAQGVEWTRSGLLTFEREFAVGRRFDDGSLAVFFCAGCDHGGRLEWTGSEYVLRPFPPAGVIR